MKYIRSKFESENVMSYRANQLIENKIFAIF